MELVCSGAIADESSMRQVIDSLLQQSNTQPSLLRITSPGQNLNGRLAVAPGGYIVSARDDSGEEGYQVIRKLLAVTDGSFALMAARQEELQQMVQNAYVELGSVLENMEGHSVSCQVHFEHDKAIADRPSGGKDAAPHAVPPLPCRPCGMPAWNRHIAPLPPRLGRFARLSHWHQQKMRLRSVCLWAMTSLALTLLLAVCRSLAQH